MSIITEAMRRAGMQRAAAAAAAAPPVDDRKRARQKVSPSNEQIREALKFKPATLNQARLQESKVLTHVEDRTARRSYKILRTRVLQRLEQNNWRSLVVTSTSTGAGKTLTSINLSLALAQDPNTWVVLVDLDLQRPNVANTLGMSHGPGVTDFLQSRANLEDIAYDVGIERLVIIPAGAPVESSSELLSAPRMSTLVQALEELTPRPIVVYDVPPLLASDDVLTVSPQMDAVLLVATEALTLRSSLEQAKETLADMNLLGVVLNRSFERDENPYY